MLSLKNFLIILIVLFSVQSFLCAGEGNVGRGTEITSDRLEMENKEEGNYFRFYDNVKVLGDNLSVVCNYLEVVSDRTAKKKVLSSDPACVSESAAAPQMGSIIKITARDHVKIEQAGRVATCGLAEILPREGKLILTESPILTDSNGRVEGHRIILFKDERRAIVDPYPQGGRTKVVLPSMPDLGFKNAKKESESTDSTSLQTPEKQDTNSGQSDTAQQTSSAEKSS